MSYNDALKIDHMAGASLDAALADFGLDAILAPTDSPAWTTDLILGDYFLFASSGLAGPSGYPIIQVPAGEVLGMPVGISFIGTAFSEPTLIKLASGFEAVTHARSSQRSSHDITKTTPRERRWPILPMSTLIPARGRATRITCSVIRSGRVTATSLRQHEPRCRGQSCLVAFNCWRSRSAASGDAAKNPSTRCHASRRTCVRWK